MSLVRRALGGCVLAVLLCQVAAMVATQIALVQPAASETASQDEVACTCVHGPDAECPMHKSRRPASSSGASSREARWCTGCSEGPQMVLTPFAFVGPVAVRGEIAAPHAASEFLVAAVAFPFDLVLPPVAPPPRG
jgi:hypothetical protein